MCPAARALHTERPELPRRWGKDQWYS